MIKVRGDYKDFGYNDVRNGWYGTVEPGSELINEGEEVQVLHDSENAGKTTGAGPLVIRHPHRDYKVRERTGSNENSEVREFDVI